MHSRDGGALSNRRAGWLERWSDPKALLQAKDSPLHREDQEALSNALAGRLDVEAIALSESLLGLRSGKNTAT